MAEPTRALGHVGISVPDLESAVDWYCTVFGLEEIVGSGEVKAADPVIGRAAIDIFGEQFGSVKMAHLASANGVAIELFEFTDPVYEAPKNNFEYWRGGIFHLAFVAKDIEHLLEVLESKGGRRVSDLNHLFDGRPLRVCYCEDPWGTIVELISESHERAFANIG